MKTSVNMVRKMGAFDVTQRTGDAFFNATELLGQWNKKTGDNKIIYDFERLKQTGEFIEELEKDIKSHEGDSLYGDCRVINVIKGKNTNKGKTKDIVWYNPYLFVKFAMWLSPKFELQVIKFVSDQLISLRHDAGDNYNGLTSAVQRFENINYPQLAKGLNYIVFGRHETGIRNKASHEQLDEMTELQKKLAFAVDMGYIRSFEELLNEMRKLYKNRY